MMLDPKQDEDMKSKKLVSAATERLRRIRSTRLSPFAPLEEEAEAMQRAEELQGYRFVLRCRTKPAGD